MGRRPFNVREIADQIENRVTDTVRQIGLAIHSDVVLATPVGDPSYWVLPAPPGYAGGHARRNWQITFVAEGAGELDGIDPFGYTALAEANIDIQGVNLGDVFYIEHYVPYAARLAFDGWSPQAPPGYVDDAIFDALSNFVGSREVI